MMESNKKQSYDLHTNFVVLSLIEHCFHSIFRHLCSFHRQQLHQNWMYHHDSGTPPTSTRAKMSPSKFHSPVIRNRKSAGCAKAKTSNPAAIITSKSRIVMLFWQFAMAPKWTLAHIVSLLKTNLVRTRQLSKFKLAIVRIRHDSHWSKASASTHCRCRGSHQCGTAARISPTIWSRSASIHWKHGFVLAIPASPQWLLLA